MPRPCVQARRGLAACLLACAALLALGGLPLAAATVNANDASVMVELRNAWCASQLGGKGTFREELDALTKAFIKSLRQLEPCQAIVVPCLAGTLQLTHPCIPCSPPRARTGRSPVPSNWASQSDLCLWSGVTCSPPCLWIGETCVATPLAVTGLILVNLGIAGTLPTRLGLLSNLTLLDLTENALSSALPTELGLLSQLTGLFVDQNKLNGSIPTQLGSLSRLQYLWLHSNALYGTLPTQLGSLSQLQFLWLSSNALSGALPTELGRLASVTNFLVVRSYAHTH